MNIGSYSLEVPEAHEIGDGYAELNHNTQYTLKLSNSSPRRCDVGILIDGERVGLWRIDPRSYICIEHPTHDTGRFTFYRLESAEAKSAEIARSSETGLITAVFFPELVEQVLRSRPATGESVPLAARRTTSPRPSDLGLEERAQGLLDSHAAGGTGLSGSSAQHFTSATRIEYDMDATVTINLRLICPKDAPRPLKPRVNPVPPPLI